MSLIDRLRGKDAPVEPAAQERAEEPSCTACGRTDYPLVPVHLGEHGAWPVCVNPATCRQYAQLAGRYCVYPVVA